MSMPAPQVDRFPERPHPAARQGSAHARKRTVRRDRPDAGPRAAARKTYPRGLSGPSSIHTPTGRRHNPSLRFTP